MIMHPRRPFAGSTPRQASPLVGTHACGRPEQIRIQFQVATPRLWLAERHACQQRARLPIGMPANKGACAKPPYSHSIVAGGFPEIS